jgi:hypothetical protein
VDFSKYGFIQEEIKSISIKEGRIVGARNQFSR